MTLLLLIGDVNVFHACFCHILFSRINTEIKVIVQRCQFLGTLLTISALPTVGSTWPASPKKQSCQQLFPHPSPVRTLPAFSDLLSLITSWFHVLWIASVLFSIYVNFTLICCETKENWGCTCALSQSGTASSFRWNDNGNCDPFLLAHLKRTVFGSFKGD